MDAPRVLLYAEPMERAMEADERANTLDFFLDASPRTRFAGNVEVEGMSPSDLDLRRKRMRWMKSTMISLASRLAGSLGV